MQATPPLARAARRAGHRRRAPADVPPRPAGRHRRRRRSAPRSPLADIALTTRDALLHPPSTGGRLDLADPDAQRAAALVAIIVALGLLEVVLLAGTAFAVGARRQLRELGLVAAGGGSPRDVRRIVLAQGLVLGALGAVAGVAIGCARRVRRALAVGALRRLRDHGLASSARSRSPAPRSSASSPVSRRRSSRPSAPDACGPSTRSPDGCASATRTRRRNGVVGAALVLAGIVLGLVGAHQLAGDFAAYDAALARGQAHRPLHRGARLRRLADDRHRGRDARDLRARRARAVADRMDRPRRPGGCRCRRASRSATPSASATARGRRRARSSSPSPARCCSRSCSPGASTPTSCATCRRCRPRHARRSSRATLARRAMLRAAAARRPRLLPGGRALTLTMPIEAPRRGGGSRLGPDAGAGLAAVGLARRRRALPRRPGGCCARRGRPQRPARDRRRRRRHPARRRPGLRRRGARRAGRRQGARLRRAAARRSGPRRGRHAPRRGAAARPPRATATARTRRCRAR